MKRDKNIPGFFGEDHRDEGIVCGILRGEAIIDNSRSKKVMATGPAYLSHCVAGSVPGGEGDERVAPIRARHRVHHQAEIPDFAALFKQRYQLVLVHVFGDLAAEHLAPVARGAALPVGWRPAVLSLSCGDKRKTTVADKALLVTPSPSPSYLWSRPVCILCAPESP